MNAGELRDYYGLLGILPSATVSDIHKAYWQQAYRCHPDKGGSHEAMVRLVEAWKILSDPNKRSRYDQLLKYRHDGWRSKKFNDDVQDARKRAEGYSSRSWAEFEAIYQKAFYTFNQDFYGEGLEGGTAGPYSPLMGNSKGRQDKDNLKSKAAENASSTKGSMIFGYIIKSFLLLVALLSLFLIYRNFIGISRYVPLGQQDGPTLLILDTTSGAVYSVDKREGAHSSAWKENVSPFYREKKWPVK